MSGEWQTKFNVSPARSRSLVLSPWTFWIWPGTWPEPDLGPGPGPELDNIDSRLSRHHSILKLDQFRLNLHSVISELRVVNGYANDIFDNKEATNWSSHSYYHDYSPLPSFMSWFDYKCMSKFSFHCHTCMLNAVSCMCNNIISLAYMLQGGQQMDWQFLCFLNKWLGPWSWWNGYFVFQWTIADFIIGYPSFSDIHSIAQSSRKTTFSWLKWESHS